MRTGAPLEVIENLQDIEDEEGQIYSSIEEIWEDYPIRSLVGGLQYVATMCRPDCMYGVNRVARSMTNCTTSVVTAAKRILRYLLQTASQGIEYSPEREAKFRAAYQGVLDKNASDCLDPDAKAEPLREAVAFSDADFAGCSVSLRSSSGSILFFRGTPVAWSSRRQTLRALSTCEAEYIALFDTIQLSLGQGYLEWFSNNGQLPNLFCDNQSSITVAKSELPTKKTKHFLLRWHLVKDYAKDIAFVPTGINAADPLTKPMMNPLLVHGPPRVANSVELGEGLCALYTSD